MGSSKRLATIGKTLTLVLLATMVLAGCSGEDSITSSAPGTSSALVEDPLDGVLNSTLDYTPADPETRIDKLAEALGLDEEQKEALLVAYIEFRTGIAALKDQVASGELTIDEAREQAIILRDAFEAELQVILTPEQYDLLQEMRQNRHVRGKGDRDPQTRWDTWLEEIGADEDQVAAIMVALETFREAMQDLRSQVASGDLTREEAIVLAQDLRAAFDAELQTILTPEQYAALQDLRPDCSRP